MVYGTQSGARRGARSKAAIFPELSVPLVAVRDDVHPDLGY